MKDTVKALTERKEELIRRRSQYDVKDLDSRISESMAYVGKLNEERDYKVSMSKNINAQIENINHAITTVELELGVGTSGEVVIPPVDEKEEDTEHESV